MSKVSLKDKVCGCLAGVAVGDAMGMPVEIMTPEEILLATGGRGVQGIIAPLQDKLKGTRDLPAGSVTDDTDLTNASARSLIRCGRFDIRDQAQEFVAEYKRGTIGWGRATTKAAKALIAFYETGVGQNPELPVPPPTKPGEGGGNGVAMKIAPLAIWNGLTEPKSLDPLLTRVMEFGLMTHGDPRASFSAYAVAMFVDKLMRRRRPMDRSEVTYFMTKVVNTVKQAEFRYQFFRPGGDRLSDKLALVLQSHGEVGRLRESVGNSCYALESIPFTLGIFLRHPQDFRAGVLEAVNAGGDADSTASMVGSLVGANCGLGAIPQEWLDAVPATAQAVRLGAKLLLAAKNR